MRRQRYKLSQKTKGQDRYGREVAKNDEIIFSWGGTLTKAVVEEVQMKDIYCHLIVRPYTLKNGEMIPVGAARVQDSRSVVII